MLDHLFGRVQLTPSQVSTGFGLLKKVLPDFSNSAPPQDDDKRDDDDDYGDGHGNAPEDPEFEVYIVDP